MNLRRALLLLLFSALTACGATVKDYAADISPLIDPAKLTTLGPRGANPRVQKAVYWLFVAKRDKADPGKVIDLSLSSVHVTNALAASLTKKELLRNLRIAESFGCVDEAGLSEMRRGHAPTVRKGPYAGDELSVDHVIPRAVVPELDNTIANLELLPLRLNERKNAKITSRQLSLAAALFKAGLLSEAGLDAVRKARR